MYTARRVNLYARLTVSVHCNKTRKSESSLHEKFDSLAILGAV